MSYVNYSPVVYYKNWMNDYKELFNMMNKYVTDKDNVLAEVIFLTHNVGRHNRNLLDNRMEEYFLWNPLLQEKKISQYGGENIRYKHDIKAKMIQEFKELHQSTISWNKIRYIF